MKLYALLFLALVPSAQGDFSIDLEGKTFTCSEGGGNGCVCKRDADNVHTIAAYVGEFKVNWGWPADGNGMIGCKAWVKSNPDTCN